MQFLTQKHSWCNTATGFLINSTLCNSIYGAYTMYLSTILNKRGFAFWWVVHEIQIPNYFLMWNTVLLTYLYNVVQELKSSCSTETLCLLHSNFLPPLISSPWQSLNSLFQFVNLTILDLSCKWNHALFEIRISKTH